MPARLSFVCGDQQGHPLQDPRLCLFIRQEELSLATVRRVYELMAAGGAVSPKVGSAGTFEWVGGLKEKPKGEPPNKNESAG